MRQKILYDITISCDPPRVPYYVQRNGPDAIAAYYESWIRDFNDFIRDHRSQDPVSLNVEREYKDVCSHCRHEWEEDENGKPLCCDKAQIEYEKERFLPRNIM